MSLKPRRRALALLAVGSVLATGLYLWAICPRPHPERDKEEWMLREKRQRLKDSAPSPEHPSPAAESEDSAPGAASRWLVPTHGEAVTTATISSHSPRPEQQVSAMTSLHESADRHHDLEQTDMTDSAIISLTGVYGREHACQLLEILEHNDRQYAMLLKIQEETLVIMRLISRDQGSAFQEIDSDEEFEDVLGHIRTVARSRADD